MSVRLYGLGKQTHSIHLATILWADILMLAHTYGWQPEDITLDKGDSTIAASWDGYYTLLALGQCVSATDAAALAVTLQRARAADATIRIRESIRDIIILCEGGGFTID